jgi:hypothetical protein
MAKDKGNAAQSIGGGRIPKDEWNAAQASEERLAWEGIKARADVVVSKLKGRPPYAWNEAKDSELLDRIANGQSLASICELEHMPAPSIVFRRIETDVSFRDRYYRAREQQGALLFDQCLQIADDQSRDLVTDSEGNAAANNAAIQRDKLRIETRMRMAGKFNSRFADKPSEASVTVNNNTLQIDGRTMDPGQREQLRAMLIEAKAGSKPTE